MEERPEQGVVHGKGNKMNEQLSLLTEAVLSDGLQKKKASAKRKWENAFQKWSDYQWKDGYTSLGKCGYGSICDYCNDNSYGRPCVRALNAMCREKNIRIDYSNFDFPKIWEGDTK